MSELDKQAVKDWLRATEDLLVQAIKEPETRMAMVNFCIKEGYPIAMLENALERIEGRQFRLTLQVPTP